MYFQFGNYFLSGIFYIWLSMILISCSGEIKNPVELDREPVLIPDYSGITIPPNIAPLNFSINEKGEKFRVKIVAQTGVSLSINSNDSLITIPSGKWRKLLQAAAGSDISIEISIKDSGKWVRFINVVNSVAKDSIDSHLVYRLIDPGFEIWNKMGIYQRDLQRFEEDPIMINEMSEHNCINCHSFSVNNKNMLFHMRGKLSGTIIYRNGILTKVNTKTDSTISAGVYPAWHPNGRLVAFSVNKITQVFHSTHDRRIEVADTVSDLILYDAETNIVSQCADIATKERYETFPVWSPDGRFLYYCSALAEPLASYEKIRYSLLKIAFDPVSEKFGAVDTVISASKTGKSVTFPRISPDGNYVLFCMSDYGNFTIWHDDSDLFLLDITSGEISKPDINSDNSESYHSWSSNGRWVVFSSRRIDGLFTTPYFAYFDSDGKFFKPFLLPQKDPLFYKLCFKSFNRPEFVSEKVVLNPRILSKAAKSEPENSSFRRIN